MSDEWYRRKTWTTQDREDFFARLRRIRGSFHKAQYARIQAYELLTTHKPDAYIAALELLDLILAEWQEDAQLALVYHHRAECFLGLGDSNQALDAFQHVFKTQRKFKGELTGAHLDFGWLVVTMPLPELYDDAMSVLDEFGPELLPIQRYRASAIRALILDSCGQQELAQAHAKMALHEATLTHSGLRYHARLGLVNCPDERVYKRLESIA